MSRDPQFQGRGIGTDRVSAYEDRSRSTPVLSRGWRAGKRCPELASAQVAAGHRVRVVTLNRVFGASADHALPTHGVVDGVEVVRVPYFGSRRIPLHLLQPVLSATQM